MKIESIKDGIKAIAHVYLPDRCYGSVAHSKEPLVSFLSEDIQDTGIGWAGFKTKQGLKNYLINAIFDTAEDGNKIIDFVLDNRRIMEAIRGAVIPCFKVLPGDLVHIFVFPTFSNFVKEEMSGTTGYTPWRNAILVFINSLNEQWRESLVSTVSHEFNHSAFFERNKCETLLDSMIFEGLAEHFRERVVSGKKAPWSDALDPTQSKKLLHKMESEGLLRSTSLKVRRAVFFGGDTYGRWTGYSIGYHVVLSFLSHNSNLEWKDIMVMKPQDILARSKILK